MDSSHPNKRFQTCSCSRSFETIPSITSDNICMRRLFLIISPSQPKWGICCRKFHFEKIQEGTKSRLVAHCGRHWFSEALLSAPSHYFNGIQSLFIIIESLYYFFQRKQLQYNALQPPMALPKPSSVIQRSCALLPQSPWPDHNFNTERGFYTNLWRSKLHFL